MSHKVKCRHCGAIVQRGTLHTCSKITRQTPMMGNDVDFVSIISDLGHSSHHHCTTNNDWSSSDSCGGGGGGD